VSTFSTNVGVPIAVSKPAQVWLILDGMVLDVGRWLPEHPGGASIIPKQSLDCDCARFFEA
jgi:cytochrome b involved in lipid metabolism